MLWKKGMGSSARTGQSTHNECRGCLVDLEHVGKFKELKSFPRRLSERGFHRPRSPSEQLVLRVRFDRRVECPLLQAAFRKENTCLSALKISASNVRPWIGQALTKCSEVLFEGCDKCFSLSYNSESHVSTCDTSKYSLMPKSQSAMLVMEVVDISKERHIPLQIVCHESYHVIRGRNQIICVAWCKPSMDANLRTWYMWQSSPAAHIYSLSNGWEPSYARGCLSMQSNCETMHYLRAGGWYEHTMFKYVVHGFQLFRTAMRWPPSTWPTPHARCSQHTRPLRLGLGDTVVACYTTDCARQW